MFGSFSEWKVKSICHSFTSDSRNLINRHWFRNVCQIQFLNHFQVSNSVENDGSMMKKKIVDSTYHWCYWFGRLIWNFSETLYRCLTKKRSRRKPRASYLEKLFIYQVNEMSPVTEHYLKSHITVFLSCVCLLRLGSREFYQNLCQIVMSNHANWCRSFWKMYF